MRLPAIKRGRQYGPTIRDIGSSVRGPQRVRSPVNRSGRARCMKLSRDGAWGRVERRSGLRDDRGERLGLANREIGQYLAVEIDAGELDAVHELRIGHP